MMKILTNILSNAFKFTPEEGTIYSFDNLESRHINVISSESSTEKSPVI